MPPRAPPLGMVLTSVLTRASLDNPQYRQMEAMLSLSAFKGHHAGAAILVCGCGPSLKELAIKPEWSEPLN